MRAHNYGVDANHPDTSELGSTRDGGEVALQHQTIECGIGCLVKRVRLLLCDLPLVVYLESEDAFEGEDYARGWNESRCHVSRVYMLSYTAG